MGSSAVLTFSITSISAGLRTEGRQVALRPAYPMLGGHRSTVSCDDLEDEPIDLIAPSEEGLAIAAFRLAYIEVDVAVAEMAEGHWTAAGHQFGHRVHRDFEEDRNRPDRHRICRA